MESSQKGLVNRYDDPLLSEYYSEIVACLPYYPELRQIVARTLKEVYVPGQVILDVGAGRGDSAGPILEEIKDISIDLLDVSKELLGEADEFLKKYSGRYRIILEDALQYLDRCSPYPIMISEFTVHNFYQEDKKILLSAICRRLEPGGSFILLDKIQQDNPEEVLALYDEQMNRYRQALEPKLLAAMIKHEDEDLKEDVRMRESETIQMLKKAGFSEVKVVKRIKRDVVILARK